MDGVGHGGVPAFSVAFIGLSFPISSEHFLQAGPNQWVQDVCTTVCMDYTQLKEVALFLTVPNQLRADLALGLYVKLGASAWQYRGAVHASHPSEVCVIDWPYPESGQLPQPGPGVAQVGVSVEPAADLMARESHRTGAKEDFAKRVAENLFHFMQSFSVAAAGGQIVVPHDILNKWFLKFSDKFRKDPDFLTRRRDTV